MEKKYKYMLGCFGIFKFAMFLLPLVILYLVFSKAGLSLSSVREITDSMPEELSFMKWIFGGMTIVGLLMTFLPVAIIGFVGYRFFKKKWKDLDADARDPINENPMDAYPPNQYQDEM